MSGQSRPGSGSPIELEYEPNFALGAIGVRPSASEVVVAGSIRRVEPRVMQTLVALAKANGAVVSRNELMARCWSGMIVSEDAVTRAIGQARRLADLAPRAFSIETIPKIGYRLVAATVLPAPVPGAHAATAPSLTRAPGVAASTAFFAVAVLVVIAAAFAVGLTTSLPALRVEAATAAASLGTPNPAARDRQLRATALMNAGGRENVLRAEQLLREALKIDPQFHAAREALIIALWSAATFVPERAGEAHAEIASLLDDEIVETPLVWRAHVMRGFQQAAAGDWLGAQRSLDKARSGVPEPDAGTADALETFLFGSVGRIAAGFDKVARRARDNPVSRDQSRALQQWLDRAGKQEEAEAEYVRSRDLPGDRSEMELLGLVRALGMGDQERIARQLLRYRETDWGRSGDDDLFAVRNDREAALSLLRRQIEGFRNEGAIPPFLAAAWASHYGDDELAVEGLRAHPESLFATAGLIWAPVFSNVRRTPAFKTFLRDFGYVEYWRAHDWGDFCRPVNGDDFECR